MILGIDEVGRGPWAGPLVVGAVVLGGVVLEGLTDSKRLTKKRRAALDVEIRNHAAGYGLGWVTAAEIDEVGLSAALRLATVRAVEQIGVPYHEIIVDGTVNFLSDTTKGRYVTTLKKADLLVPSVSAASIIAKEARDAYMAAQDEVYPGYRFSSHVGYGTAAHQAAIEKLGVTPLHRLSYAPLAKYRSQKKAVGVSGRAHMETSKQTGDMAETEVANYLVRSGHEIVVRNWKTKYCEIDIVSKKDSVLYFTEVKYRKNAQFGDGVAAITPKKMKQMHFAVHVYESSHDVSRMDLRLAVAAVTGEHFAVENWLLID